jgi:hypothetical protein
MRFEDEQARSPSEISALPTLIAGRSQHCSMKRQHEALVTRRRFVAIAGPACGTGLGAFEPPTNLRRLIRSSVPCALVFAFASSLARLECAFESASGSEREDAAEAGARPSADDAVDGAVIMRADELADRGALAAEKLPEYVDATAEDEFFRVGGSS